MVAKKEVAVRGIVNYQKRIKQDVYTQTELNAKSINELLGALRLLRVLNALICKH